MSMAGLHKADSDLFEHIQRNRALHVSEEVPGFVLSCAFVQLQKTFWRYSRWSDTINQEPMHGVHDVIGPCFMFSVIFHKRRWLRRLCPNTPMRITFTSRPRSSFCLVAKCGRLNADLHFQPLWNSSDVVLAQSCSASYSVPFFIVWLLPYCSWDYPSNHPYESV